MVLNGGRWVPFCFRVGPILFGPLTQVRRINWKRFGILCVLRRQGLRINRTLVIADVS